MANDEISINRQDTYSKTVNLKDEDGNLIDASGWTIYFTVRDFVADTSISVDTDALISTSFAGSASGIHTLTLTSSETNICPGNYFYDFQVKKTDGTISSPSKGNFIIKGDITRTT
jgi:hypothetical protein